MNRTSPFQYFARASTAAFLLLIAPAQAQDSTSCAQWDNSLREGFALTEIVKDQLGHQRAMLERAEEQLQGPCRDHARLAWVHLRLLEIGASRSTYPAGLRTPEIDARWREAAARQAAHFPDSAPIATMHARALGTVDAAQHALQLDPDYAPAKAALAEAWLNGVRPDAAAAALRAVRDLSVLADGFSLLARIRLAQGDTGGAIQAAKRALSGPLQPIEPGRSALPEVQAREVLAQAHLHQRQYDQAAHALRWIEGRSALADELMAHPEPRLHTALDKLPRTTTATTARGEDHGSR